MRRSFQLKRSSSMSADLLFKYIMVLSVDGRVGLVGQAWGRFHW